MASPVVPLQDQDLPDVWSAELPPGGYVCSGCGQPVESEPCREHQPHRFYAVYGDPADVATAINAFMELLTGYGSFRTDAAEVERYFFPSLKEARRAHS